MSRRKSGLVASLSRRGWSDEQIAILLDCRARLTPEQQAEWDRLAAEWLVEEATAARLSERSDITRGRDADELGESAAHWKYNRSWRQTDTLGRIGQLAESVGWTS